ncbi:MAG: hypothetical protein LBJ69_04065 [Holosporales bacterium]|nr:hypothetical protein [Holosporales bacterium]
MRRTKLLLAAAMISITAAEVSAMEPATGWRVRERPGEKLAEDMAVDKAAPEESLRKTPEEEPKHEAQSAPDTSLKAPSTGAGSVPTAGTATRPLVKDGTGSAEVHVVRRHMLVPPMRAVTTAPTPLERLVGTLRKFRQLEGEMQSASSVSSSRAGEPAPGIPDGCGEPAGDPTSTPPESEAAISWYESLINDLRGELDRAKRELDLKRQELRESEELNLTTTQELAMARRNITALKYLQETSAQHFKELAQQNEALTRQIETLTQQIETPRRQLSQSTREGEQEWNESPTLLQADISEVITLLDFGGPAPKLTDDIDTLKERARASRRRYTEQQEELARAREQLEKAKSEQLIAEDRMGASLESIDTAFNQAIDQLARLQEVLAWTIKSLTPAAADRLWGQITTLVRTDSARAYAYSTPLIAAGLYKQTTRKSGT